MLSAVTSTFARRQLVGYRAMVYPLAGIAGVGFIVCGHHMFQSGVDPRLGTGFMIATIMSALPSAVNVFHWIGSVWGSNMRLTTPVLKALGFVAMLVIGVFRGLLMAGKPADGG